eukprot:10315965-Ditylum_brightwellii.AAC.1
MKHNLRGETRRDSGNEDSLLPEQLLGRIVLESSGRLDKLSSQSRFDSKEDWSLVSRSISNRRQSLFCVKMSIARIPDIDKDSSDCFYQLGGPGCGVQCRV